MFKFISNTKTNFYRTFGYTLNPTRVYMSSYFYDKLRDLAIKNGYLNCSLVKDYTAPKVADMFIYIDNNLRGNEIKITAEDTSKFVYGVRYEPINEINTCKRLYGYDDSVDAMRYYAEDIMNTKKWCEKVSILPKRYIVNDNACILFWYDGTKTVVKRAWDDQIDPAKAFLWAYFEKTSGLSKTKANKYLRGVVTEYSKWFYKEFKDKLDQINE